MSIGVSRMITDGTMMKSMKRVAAGDLCYCQLHLTIEIQRKLVHVEIIISWLRRSAVIQAVQEHYMFIGSMCNT